MLGTTVVTASRTAAHASARASGVRPDDVAELTERGPYAEGGRRTRRAHRMICRPRGGGAIPLTPIGGWMGRRFCAEREAPGSRRGPGARRADARRLRRAGPVTRSRP